MKHNTHHFLASTPRRAVCIVLWLAFAAATSWAEPLVITGSSGSLQATLQFEMVEGQLWITLSNTSEAGAFYPADMLGGVFFDIANDPILTPLWARVDTGSCLIYPGDIGCSSPAPNPGPVDSNQNIGGEWAYLQYDSGSPSQIPTGQRYAIRAVGFDIAGPSVRFDPTQNLGGPTEIDGGDFSLAPTGGIPTPTTGTVNGGLINNAPYIMYSAVFAFTPENGFNLGAAIIRNIRFQYGTDLSGTSIEEEPVPEPVTMAMLGAGLIALALLRRRAVR